MGDPAHPEQVGTLKGSTNFNNGSIVIGRPHRVVPEDWMDVRFHGLKKVSQDLESGDDRATVFSPHPVSLPEGEGWGEGAFPHIRAQSCYLLSVEPEF